MYILIERGLFYKNIYSLLFVSRNFGENGLQSLIRVLNEDKFGEIAAFLRAKICLITGRYNKYIQKRTACLSFLINRWFKSVVPDRSTAYIHSCSKT